MQTKAQVKTYCTERYISHDTTHSIFLQKRIGNVYFKLIIPGNSYNHTELGKVFGFFFKFELDSLGCFTPRKFGDTHDLGTIHIISIDF